MENQDSINQTVQGIESFLTQANPVRSFLILVAAVLGAYWLSRFVAKAIVAVARRVASDSDSASQEDKVIRLRQIETYLSVSIAAMRLIIAIVVGVLVWQALSPSSASSIAAIGAGTFFIVFAGQTLGSLLRDITSGATMIIEKWFNIGDYVKIEPFSNVAGVVERLTLRSTRVRTLTGEVVWVHNQNIMAVHVTPQGVRKMAVDVFTHSRQKGEDAITKIIDTIPTGPTLLARPLRIKYAEQWDDKIWRITIVGETAPGREWLIEKYFVDALKEVDEGKNGRDRLFIHEPISRYTDPKTDERFKRAIRLQKDK